MSTSSPVLSHQWSGQSHRPAEPSNMTLTAFHSITLLVSVIPVTCFHPSAWPVKGNMNGSDFLLLSRHQEQLYLLSVSLPNPEVTSSQGTVKIKHAGHYIAVKLKSLSVFMYVFLNLKVKSVSTPSKGWFMVMAIGLHCSEYFWCVCVTGGGEQHFPL